MDSSLSSIYFHVSSITDVHLFCISAFTKNLLSCSQLLQLFLKVLQATQMPKTSAVLETQCGNGFIFSCKALCMCRDFKYL